MNFLNGLIIFLDGVGSLLVEILVEIDFYVREIWIYLLLNLLNKGYTAINKGVHSTQPGVRSYQ